MNLHDIAPPPDDLLDFLKIRWRQYPWRRNPIHPDILEYEESRERWVTLYDPDTYQHEMDHWIRRGRPATL